MFAILCAFDFSSICRLKQTWKALPSKYMEMYNEMKTLCSVQTHYFPYKQMLITKTPPLVPYLGVFLRDLTFIEIGNPTYLDKKKEMINYDKFRMLAAVLEDIRKYQQIPYSFEPLDDVQTALRVSMQTLDEDELFNLSKTIESNGIRLSGSRKISGSPGFIKRLKQSLDN